MFLYTIVLLSFLPSKIFQQLLTRLNYVGFNLIFKNYLFHFNINILFIDIVLFIFFINSSIYNMERFTLPQTGIHIYVHCHQLLDISELKKGILILQTRYNIISLCFSPVLWSIIFNESSETLGALLDHDQLTLWRL